MLVVAVQIAVDKWAVVSSPETIPDIILTTSVTQLLVAKELLNPFYIQRFVVVTE
jgi:hypothetical protein